MRMLTDYELNLVAGGTGSSDIYNWNDGYGGGGGGGGGGIVVIGPSSYYPPYVWNPNDGAGQGGGGSSGSDPSPDLTHEATCGTADGAAKQIADEIKNAPAVAGRGDWTQVELGTFVVRTADGRYGALESTIYTDNQYNGVTIPDVWGDDYVEGIVHNHPDSLGNDRVDALNRYPGEGDWAALEVLYNAYSPHYPGYDPSVWIMDRWGVLREFKFSERATIQGLTDDQKVAREGLDGRERTDSCS